MRDQVFKCHYCNERINGGPKMVVAMIMGFVWNPSRFEWPAWFFDYCAECKAVYIAKYEEGRELRRQQVEAQKSRDWEARFGLIRGEPGYSLQYRSSPKSPKVPMVQKRSGQIEYQFLPN